LIDYVLHRYRTLRTALDVAGLKGLLVQTGVVLGALLQAIASNPIVIALALAAAAYQLYRRLQRPKKKARPIPPRVIALNRLLERMDRHVQQHGITRRPAETLHQFAHRIARDHPDDPALDSAAAWYIDYATIRFQATGDERTDLDHLAAALKG
jgi:hypothetical protein